MPLGNEDVSMQTQLRGGFDDVWSLYVWGQEINGPVFTFLTILL